MSQFNYLLQLIIVFHMLKILFFTIHSHIVNVIFFIKTNCYLPSATIFCAKQHVAHINVLFSEYAGIYQYHATFKTLVRMGTTFFSFSLSYCSLILVFKIITFRVHLFFNHFIFSTHRLSFYDKCTRAIITMSCLVCLSVGYHAVLCNH